uniref:One cut domain family member n=1 Tax=Panagrolaimus sp. ES5 TaxID=591445 RepID=A0AC34FFF5_9BILA
MTGNNFLQIDPTHFNGSTTRHYDDLPENFLETVSPHNTGPPLPLSSLPNHHDNGGSHLAGLGSMSVTGSEFHRYNGPASLLSPLQLDNPLGVTRNGRASEMLSSLRTNNTYVKEEMNSDLGFNHEYEVPMYLHQPSQQELERMTAATPPAISSDILGNSCIPGNEFKVVQYEVATSQAYIPQNHDHLQLQSQPPPQQQQQTSRRSRARAKNVNSQQQQQQQQLHHSNTINNAGPSSNEDATSPPQHHHQQQQQAARQPRATGKIAYELKQHSIPQAIFAERILCRSQGTLSDLLRNPKPWNRLKSGRETFRRMFNWVQQPLHVRLSILDMYKDNQISGPMGSMPIATTTNVMSPPTPAQNARQNSRARLATDESGGSAKRPRLVFTDIQKRTLQAIFKETQRPSREMQQTIAEHLRLDMSTVSNFFMNARRRSRNGSVVEDEPAPYQQIRPITPPPESPTSTPRHTTHSSRNRSFKSPATPHHIDEAVAAVAHGRNNSSPNQSFHSSPQDLISPTDNDVYSDILDSAGQLLDDNVQNWDESADIKPSRSDFISQHYDEDSNDQQQNPNDSQQVFISPRSVDNAYINNNGSSNGAQQHHGIRQIFSNDSKQPASAPGSVHSN